MLMKDRLMTPSFEKGVNTLIKIWLAWAERMLSDHESSSCDIFQEATIG